MTWDAGISDEIAADFARLAGCVDLRRAWLFGFHRTGEKDGASESREENRAAKAKVSPAYAEKRKRQLAEAQERWREKHRKVGPRVWSCSRCGGKGHNARTCRERA